MMNNTKAEMIVKLLNSLRHNELTIFTFIKKDGSKRVAYGTLKRDTFERMGMGFDKYDKARAQVATQPVLVYWDFERGAFRSFVTENFCENEGFISINEEHTSRRIIAEVSKGFNPRIEREMLKDLTMEFGGDIFPMSIGKCEGFGIEVESKPIAGGVAGTMEQIGSIAVPKMPMPSVPVKEEVLNRVPTMGVEGMIAEVLAGAEGGKVAVADLTELLVKVYCEGVRKGAELASISK